MSDNTVQCDIVSAERMLFSEQVSFLSVTGSDGELGISPGHTPLLTALKPGVCQLRLANGEEEVFYTSGGYLEVQPNSITILADTVQRAHDINEAAAEEARQLAERDMTERKSEIDYTRAAGELAEAAARLRAVRQLRDRR